MLNKNERHGKVDQIKGQIKQAVGTVTNDAQLKAEGQAEETIGKAREAVGHVTHKAADAIQHVVKTVKH
jgi:uncharacterized protein YjbJ (UPF0337 family)